MRVKDGKHLLKPLRVMLVASLQGHLPHGTAVVPPPHGTDHSGPIPRVLVRVQEVQHSLSVQVHSIIQVCRLGADLRYRHAAP
jgi:hypothetical protein